MNQVQCLHCANSDVYKISALFRNGNWSGTSSGLSVGGGHFFGGGSFGTVGVVGGNQSGSTQLAALLSPPIPPMEPRLGQASKMGCLSLGAGCLSLALFAVGMFAGGLTTIMVVDTSSTMKTAILLIFMSMVSLAFMFILGQLTRLGNQSKVETLYHQAMAEYMPYRAVWEKEQNIWESAYYCPKCDRVFLQGEARSVSPDRWRELIR